MIVKNEEKVIERLLRTVSPLVDWYTIIDTGSTDKTKEIITKTMQELGIPGEVLDHEWVNFCTARNFALESIKGKAKWGFWIDADEQVIYDPKFSKLALKQHLERGQYHNASTQVVYGRQKYFRSQLFLIDFDWVWKGAVHEVMLPKVKGTPLKNCQVEGFHTLVTPDGASWGDGSKEAQKKKYEDHAVLLHEYIKTDPDVRWIFYLAQSYRDCFDFVNAEKWYTERVNRKDGYWEELYFSQLMVAAAQAAQRKPISEVLESYMQCSKFDANRCEHYLPIIKHHQATGNWPTAYAISKFCCERYGGKNPFPKSSLFVDNSTYDWVLYDLHSMSAYYMGKYAESRTVYNKLRKAINKGLVPEHETKRILDNQKWYTKKWEEEMKKKPRPYHMTF
jgi:glycosyltransferase involved in cell wall biosynthesis